MNKDSNISRNELFNQLNSKHAVEQLSDFEREAFEGWKSSGYTPDKLKALDRRFAKSVAKPWKLSLILGISGILIVTIVLFFLISKPTAQAPVVVKVDKLELALPSAIEALKEIPENKQITVTELVSHNRARKKVNPTTVEISKPDEVVLKPLPANIPMKPIALTFQRRAKEYYLNDLKAIDYSSIRVEKTVPVEQITLTGVPANFENTVSNEIEETSVETHQIPYTEFLERTFLHLRKGNWKHALARLNELLATYPDDINGHFYAGWCNYNLGQYEQAKVNFSACLQLEYSNFNEEANWYLALTYDKTGQHQDAKKMFQQIVNQQGHYAQQASKALRK